MIFEYFRMIGSLRAQESKDTFGVIWSIIRTPEFLCSPYRHRTTLKSRATLSSPSRRCPATVFAADVPLLEIQARPPHPFPSPSRRSLPAITAIPTHEFHNPVHTKNNPTPFSNPRTIRDSQASGPKRGDNGVLPWRLSQLRGSHAQNSLDEAT